MTRVYLLCLVAGTLAWSLALWRVKRAAGYAPWWSALLWYASGFMGGAWIMYVLAI